MEFKQSSPEISTDSSSFVATNNATSVTKSDDDSGFVSVASPAAPQRKKLGLFIYIWVAFRSYILQNAFNLANFQGIGYANAIYPGLKRIYGRKTLALREAVISNIEFFNSNPQFVPLIFSLHLTLLDNGVSVANARTIKISLMGPLSGIGDTISQFALFPLFSSIGAALSATNGSIIGPVIFLVGINIVLIAIKVIMGYLGWKLGESVISKISDKLQSIIKIASMIGVTVISSLAVRLTKVNFNLVQSQVEATGHVQTVSAQVILNNIAPYLVSGLWIIFIYLMVSKFNWNAYRVIVVTVLVGLTLSVFGILQ